MSADDLAESLKTYKIHLEQVQAALLSGDPGNEELLKLRADLEEVIALSTNLADPTTTTSTTNNTTTTTTTTTTSSQPHESEDVAASGSGEGASSNSSEATQQWSVGDACVAQWSDDKQWYKARIDAITTDGMVAISFEDYGSSDVTQLSQLKSVLDAATLLTQPKGPRKRQMQEAQRQQQKKKKQKKFDRQKQIDEAHEQDKHKWQTFASKSKKMKGVTRKSIFATPEAANGRVGIGTCGIGGKPMTDYTLAEKRRRGM